ncbi:MAG: GNAT family N-acetyltransferase [Chthoniobacterales bacterium]|nr:GNAT family N-acetyltransferase [Chthoniobacterales bacterium]
MKVLETERLVLRRLGTDDAAFILQLLNEPSWLNYIGDKSVRTVEDARNYIENRPVAMYRRLGFGLYLVELKGSGEPIGICGLIKRESLEEIDLGFAFLPSFWGKGFAFEAAGAVMEYGRGAFGIPRLLAVTSQDNHVSVRLLEKLGFRFERMARLESGATEVKVFATS